VQISLAAGKFAVFRRVKLANDESASANGEKGDRQEGQEPLTPQHPDAHLLRDDALD
jgi:hypothetical protein